jgi:hypothetical protein
MRLRPGWVIGEGAAWGGAGAGFYARYAPDSARRPVAVRSCRMRGWEDSAAGREHVYASRDKPGRLHSLQSGAGTVVAMVLVFYALRVLSQRV